MKMEHFRSAGAKRCIFLCGPTASGKSALALNLAERLNAEIVSVDSQQVYRGMDIGTAKPNAAERAAIPHHLIDVVEPDQPFHAAQFLRRADEAIAEINRRGKPVIAVGGTGLYFQALLQGLSSAPPRNAEYRRVLESRIERQGLAKLYDELQTLDPERASELPRNDRTRIIRALEIYHLTGKSQCAWNQQQITSGERYHTFKIGLEVGRAELYRRINERVDQMLQRGFVEEVKGLLKKYGETPQAFRAVGYRELIQHLTQGLPLERAVELIKQNTRRYAKRQMTWFHRDPSVRWFSPSQIEEILHAVSVWDVSG